MYRIRVIFAGLVIAFILLWGRLFYWQVLMNDSLSAVAFAQYTTRFTTQASRGNIVSSDGFAVVVNNPNYRLVADPSILKDNPKELSKMIAELFVEEYEQKSIEAHEYLQSATESARLRRLQESSASAELVEELYPLVRDDNKIRQQIEDDSRRILALLEQKDRKWVQIYASISPNMKKILEEKGIQGIQFEEQYGRTYPDPLSIGNISGILISDENGDPQGAYGLEGAYEGELVGSDGRTWHTKDVFGHKLLTSESRQLETQNGSTLHLYIDRNLQHIIYKKLEQGVKKFGALGGEVVVMDPQTGGVVAMVSFPAFNPDYWLFTPAEMYQNPIISKTYEPGSTFKVLVMAAGVDADVITPDTRCTICNGPRKVGPHLIRTWNNQYQNNPSMTDVLVHSDNTGMVYVGDKLGNQRLYDSIKKMGFGEKTGIDLQEDAAAPLRPYEDMREIDFATMTFGQGIAVTPLQMVRAVSAIANGGLLKTPHVVMEIHRDNKVIPTTNQTEQRIFSERAADLVTGMMTKSAAFGEAKFAFPKGYSIAGKTGTAQIAIEGEYDEKKTIASFIGFAPAMDPKFVMLVKIDQPTSSQWGSETAAPLWFDISKEILRYYGIMPVE